MGSPPGTSYQNTVTTAWCPGRTGLAEAVARNLFKLMAYKDEYEVARLYTDGNFRKQVETAFDGRHCASNSIWRRRCSRARTRPPASRAR